MASFSDEMRSAVVVMGVLVAFLVITTIIAFFTFGKEEI